MVGSMQGKGVVVLLVGLVCGALRFVVQHFAPPGPTTDFVTGVLTGLALVAFLTASYLLARSRLR